MHFHIRDSFYNCSKETEQVAKGSYVQVSSNCKTKHGIIKSWRLPGEYLVKYLHYWPCGRKSNLQKLLAQFSNRVLREEILLVSVLCENRLSSLCKVQHLYTNNSKELIERLNLRDRGRRLPTTGAQ